MGIKYPSTYKMESYIIKKEDKTEKKAPVTNAVKLVGKVINYYETPSVYIVSLLITYKKGTDKFQANFPKIYFFKNDNTGADKIVLHDHVEIEAHVAAPRKNRANGDVYYSQAIVGDKIKLSSSVYEKEFGVDGGNIYPAPENCVFLRGKVRKVEQVAKGVVNIVMNARNKSYNNVVLVTSFRQDAILNAPGDEIAVYAIVTTHRKEKNGKAVFYENIVARKIDNLSKKQAASVKNEPNK